MAPCPFRLQLAYFCGGFVWCLLKGLCSLRASAWVVAGIDGEGLGVLGCFVGLGKLKGRGSPRECEGGGRGLL